MAAAIILVVDDNESVRTAVRKALLGDGHEVLEARSLEAARAIASVAHVDLVVCDLVLPDGNGPDLAQVLRVLGSDAPMLFMSGYRAGAEGLAFISKPFTRTDLTAAVDAMLCERCTIPLRTIPRDR
jgi:two-component system, cell cycle sensor histidine kinase and response regulator CckA